MSRQEKWLAAIFAVLVLVVVLLAVNLWILLSTANPLRMMPMMPMTGTVPSGMGAAPAGSMSNGERIFKTGTNARGESVPNSMMTGMGGCVMCHGADAHGGQMMGREEPCNTFKCLSAKGYSMELIKRAITQGIGADGRQLDLMMPRWQLSDSDLNDVVTYLKVLP